ncbi:MAG: hypothetical protein PVJ60_08165, partial [Phycisphaerales bacterium]
KKRKKAGLHKKVSTIFDGVPGQQDDDAQKHIETTEPQSTSQIESEAVKPESLTPTPEQPVTESTQSLASEAEQALASQPQPEEVRGEESNVPEVSDTTNSLVFKMDEFDTKEPQQQESEEKKLPLPKPKKPVILTMEESDTPEEEEFVRSESQEAQSSTPEKPPVLKTEEATQPLPEDKPNQELQADVDDGDEDDTEQDSSDKFAAIKIAGKRLWEQIDKKLLTPKPGVNPTKHKATVITIPVLFVALIFVLRGVFGTPVRNTKASEEDNTSKAAASLDNSIEWEIPAPYKSKFRNPLRLGSAETGFDDEIDPGQLVHLDLRGILYTEDKSSAAINGQVMYEGEKIRGVTIVKITKESVEFEFNGKRWTQKVR